MLQKSLGLDCDSLIFDLEDSVPLDQKENARKLILETLEKAQSSTEKKGLCLRTNQLDSALAKDDVSAFLRKEEAGAAIDCLVIPKAEEASLKDLSRLAEGKEIIAIIETAKGFVEMEEIARTEGVVGLAYGAADMALSMKGSVKVYEKNEYVRTQLAIISRCYGLNPIDRVFFDLNDAEGFRKEAQLAKGLGYSGKFLIHPNQIEIANQIFASWSDEQIAWAKEVVEAYEKSLEEGSKGAIRLKEQLIDAVHYRIAKDILESQHL